MDHLYHVLMWLFFNPGNGPPPSSANVTLNKPPANTVKETPKGKKDKKGKKKLTKEDISTPTDFRHVSHVGWDPNTGLDVSGHRFYSNIHMNANNEDITDIN